ncbi:hypothetical protein [Actinoplanes sp. NPDC051859]|uniref:hypothetical protein n=1 Tax=Actinoplanes sp. NPDC051859 TaxID=3363909 RepID=UPI00379D3EA8
MVTRLLSTAGLRPLERSAVAVLARLLPAGFRDRQRQEWTADLMTLSSTRAAVRWRYLLAAAWTLPALRSIVRTGFGGGPFTATAAPTLVLVARVLTIGLGWPVISWLVAVALRYQLYDVPSRRAAGISTATTDLWPSNGPLVVLGPLWGILEMGAWIAYMGGPFLIARSVCP